MAKGARVPGTMETFFNILRTQGIRGVNKGVNAVALRQITGWSSRMGISKAAEGPIRKLKGKGKTDKLTVGEKIAASTVGGALSCWNQPFEVSKLKERYRNAKAKVGKHHRSSESTCKQSRKVRPWRHLPWYRRQNKFGKRMAFEDSSAASYPESESRRGRQFVWSGLETKFGRDLRNEFDVVRIRSGKPNPGGGRPDGVLSAMYIL